MRAAARSSSPTRQPRRRDVGREKRASFVPVRRVRPPRAARDALAGEAAFFARHDAFGVARGELLGALRRVRRFEFRRGQRLEKGEGFDSRPRDDFGIDRNGDDFLREWLRREPRAWREPFETPDRPTIPKLGAIGVLSAASPEPLDRSQLELVNELVERNETPGK